MVMYVIYIMFFCRYANHIFVSHIVRTNHRYECELPPIMRTPPICGKSFSFGGEQIEPICCHGIVSSCCILTKLKTLT
jgi:hypothetical protein